MGCGTVSSGPYKAFTTQEILDLLKVVDDAIKAHKPGSGALTSASVNGKSFTYAANTSDTDSLSSLLRQRNDLLNALADATGNPDLAGNPSRTTAVFRTGWGTTSNCGC